MSSHCDLSGAPAGLLVVRPETRDELRDLVHALSSDPNLHEDLVQEALLSWWQAEVKQPQKPATWYRQCCHYSLLDYFKQGRSVDSPRHRSSTCTDDPSAALELPADGGIFPEICERDAVQELMGRLKPAEQRTLLLLRKELTVREIARELHVSHAAVIGWRRHIAAVAASLGIHA